MLAFVPFIVLIVLLVCCISVFGNATLDGASQVSLIIASGVCVLIGWSTRRLDWVNLEKEMTSKVASCTPYQVTIRKVNQAEGSYDPLVRDTMLSIIEEFFESNQSVLLYICDKSDGRQQARNMLFLRWLRDYDTSGRYRISTCNVVVEGEMWYTAIIVRVDNPLCDTVTAEYEADASRLREKPE